jgi:energy-coupling factor transporter transmembrane protein EcfT
MNETLIHLSYILYFYNIFIQILTFLFTGGLIWLGATWFIIFVKLGSKSKYDDFVNFKLTCKIYYRKYKKQIKLLIAIFILSLFLPSKTQITLYYMGKSVNSQQIIKFINKIEEGENKQ